MTENKLKDKIVLLLADMEGKDTSAAYKALQELERISDQTGLLYPYTDMFADKALSGNYVMTVRGFRLLCRQARWDVDNKLGKWVIPAIQGLGDVKPTAVRQALAALVYVMEYKPEMRDSLCRAISGIDCTKYKDTMRPLIEKDIKELLQFSK